MRCAVCKKGSQEVELFEGILNVEMIMICPICAEKEGIPIIRKPSEEQLSKGEERASVRERMEKMSGMKDRTEISGDQTAIQGNLAKLRVPEKKERHEDVLDDYYWTLNMSRRRKKWSINQLAEKIGIEPEIIQDIEKGKIPQNFEEVFTKFEVFFGIKLLKNYRTKVKFTRTKDEEMEILKSVRQKMNDPSESSTPPKKEIDFSSKESMEDVTLNDLVEMKRQREKQETKMKSKVQTDAMVGDDIDLELDEL